MQSLYLHPNQYIYYGATCTSEAKSMIALPYFILQRDRIGFWI